MPHTKNRGTRKPITYEKKIAAKKAEHLLQKQQSYARHIVSTNAFRDLVIGERINLLEQKEITRQVTATYPTAPPEAIPTLQDGSVLTIPNKYHLELFPNCNQAALTISSVDEIEDLELAEDFIALENDAALNAD